MQRSDFSFWLPDSLIARSPLRKKTASRLLCLKADNSHVEDRSVSDLIELIRPGDVVVANNTKVITARLHGRKSTGGRVEVLIDRILTTNSARVLVKSSKSFFNLFGEVKHTNVNFAPST